MADLVTHLCSMLLPAAFLPRRWMGPLYLGVAAPDLCSRGPGLTLQLVHRHVTPLPEALFWPWDALHTPIGLAFLFLAATALFAPGDRPRVLACFGAGAAAHFALDLLQDHHGQGYFLLFPFVGLRFELGWISSEATVTWALPLLAATAIAWGIRLWRGRAAPSGTPS